MNNIQWKLLFGLCLLSVKGLLAQDSAKVLYVIADEVGETIDSTEKQQYHLFPFCTAKDFKEAEFQQLPDHTYLLRIALKNGEVKTYPYSKADIAQTKAVIKGVAGTPVSGVHVRMNRDEKRAAELKRKRGKNAVYTELLGSIGTPVSVNYERIFFTENTWFSIRGGFSHHAEEVSEVISFFGKNTVYGHFRVAQTVLSGTVITGGWRNHFECGLGMVYNFTYDQDPAGQYPAYGTFQGQIAYRYQKPCSGLFFKAGVALYTDKYQGTLFGNSFPFPFLSLGGSF